jgi:L-ascorbate metabolism protein UlaG (beta-lactamase superfamily)
MTGLARLSGLMLAVITTLAVTGALSHALAQTPQPPAAKPEMMENCPGLIAADTPRVIPAAMRLALNPDQVKVSYAGHSTFLIESPQGVRIATDYNDYVRPAQLPDIATMNHAHDSHFTNYPDPRIPHALRGWGPSPQQPARHDLQVRDVRVRNVPTNIRSWNGGTELHGNSIFVFETANMCIGHLGHLHHTLNQQQLNELGRLDILFVPVDGNLTLDLEGMFEVLTAIKAPLMVPMHYFSAFTLHQFLNRARQNWTVDMSTTPSFVMSKTTLPAQPKVLVLPGR